MMYWIKLAGLATSRVVPCVYCQISVAKNSAITGVTSIDHKYFHVRLHIANFMPLQLFMHPEGIEI